MTTKHEWTAEELVAELKRRERQGRSAGARSAGVTARFRDMSDLSSAELARMAQAHQRVIYGVDDRQDLFQVTNTKIKKAADAVVALVKKSDLTADGSGGWTLATTSYRDEFELCSTEPFAAQPLGCFCSGFLVAPDVIATAGHCVKSPAQLADMRFVFGFRMLDANRARTAFSKDDVYEGKEIIDRKLTEDQTDWALVRLTQPVTGRAPVAYRTSGKIGTSQKLFVIGHPCGLPQKYAPGAQVRHNSPKAFFVANLDTYGGNSGSPVFDGTTQKVEGILVRGENDFVDNGSCNVSLVCPSTGCRGEDVTRATEWASQVPQQARKKKGTKKKGTKKTKKK